MELLFKDWVKERELEEIDLSGILSKAKDLIPKNPRELAYALISQKSMTPDAQAYRRGYLHGKAAARSGKSLSDNPYQQEDEIFHNAWIHGFSVG